MKRIRWRWIALSATALAVVAIGALRSAFDDDMRRVAERMSGQSRVIETSRGAIEFAAWGSGPAVLVVHGAGGGYDQGVAIAGAFGGDGLRWIAPSRFGYLGSALPADASTAAQADAFAELLDALGVERVAIVAMSGGVPPALQFALRHPARTASLVALSSAPYTPLEAKAQQLPVPAWVYQALFGSDLPYWVMQKTARSLLERLFDVGPTLRETLSPRELAFVSGMVDAFQPVSRRVDGLRNEAAAIDPRASYPLGRIETPTLVVHARDDGINPFAFGEHTARNIRGAQFMPLDAGGHLLLGHQAAIRSRVNEFLRRHAQVRRTDPPAADRRDSGARAAAAACPPAGGTGDRCRRNR